MSLLTLDLPAPAALRPGWAALAAVHAARGWDDVRADARDWVYHDGGGNWACLRWLGGGRAVLFGHDHEYSETYWGAAAEFFGEPGTDLLAGAPVWWGADLAPPPEGEWVGFVYGWDGLWRRAPYAAEDGFRSVGLVEACVGAAEHLLPYAADAPGLGGEPDPGALAALVEADAAITPALVEAAVPGWDAAAGAAAGRRFLAHP